jgi:hypothetical protein
MPPQKASPERAKSLHRVANFQTASYHRDNITGNRDYRSGTFWHTPFTGQYPRDPSQTFEKRQAEIQQLRDEAEKSGSRRTGD